MTAIAPNFDVRFGTGFNGSAPSRAESPVIQWERSVGTRTSTNTSTEADLSVADLVSNVKLALGVNVSELARILGVERPTIYSWIKGSASPVASNWARINEVADYATYWSQRSTNPLGEWARRPIDNHRSLLEALSEPIIQHFEVMAILRALEVSPRARRMSIRDRGIRLFEMGSGQAEIDRVSARPAAPEE